MEADWEVEVGPGAPVIEAFWAGLVDLRTVAAPMLAVRLAEISEIEGLPTLEDALVRLNGTESSFWTSKCDVWQMEVVDPDEMEARVTDALVGRACYLDLLPCETTVFTGLDVAERVVRGVVGDLRSRDCTSSRVDMIVRQAVAGDAVGYGITIYVAGCGADAAAASAALARALKMAADVLLLHSKFMQD